MSRINLESAGKSGAKIKKFVDGSKFSIVYYFRRGIYCVYFGINAAFVRGGLL
jgi:hypothetical protein